MAVTAAAIALAGGSAAFLGWFFVALCREAKRAGIGRVVLLHSEPGKKEPNRGLFVVHRNPQVTVKPTNETQSQQRLVSGERKR